MKICINYADPLMRPAQQLCTKTALEAGGFDKVIEYSPSDLDQDFVRENRQLLQKEGRGVGFFLWKPYLIRKTLRLLGPDDVLCYVDAGCFFIRSMDHYIALMEKTKRDIIPFYHSYPPTSVYVDKEKTKRDAFVLMDCDTDRYKNTMQRVATFCLWRTSALTLNFVDEWLHYSKDERILSDDPNKCGKPNYRGFIQHQHDQSIFSLLTKKYNIPAYPAPLVRLPDWPRFSYGKSHINFFVKWPDRVIPCYHIDKKESTSHIAFDIPHRQIWQRGKQERYKVYISYDIPPPVVIRPGHRGPIPLWALGSYGLKPPEILWRALYRICHQMIRWGIIGRFLRSIVYFIRQRRARV